jgi:hypothetical protein
MYVMIAVSGLPTKYLAYNKEYKTNLDLQHQRLLLPVPDR